MIKLSDFIVENIYQDKDKSKSCLIGLMITTQQEMKREIGKLLYHLGYHLLQIIIIQL